jgi:outer membrane protein assembly factor BamE (lipoprotein component of BamABCDE complex)
MRNRNRLYRWLVALILAMVLVGVVGVVGLTVATLPTPKVTRSNCEKVREGMTQEEVEAILGRVDNIWASEVDCGPCF